MRVFVPLPDVYDAVRSVEPVSKVSVGVPPVVVTVTDSLNVTWMETVALRATVPFAVDDVTLETVGT